MSVLTMMNYYRLRGLTKLRELFYQHAKLCATHPLVVLSLAFTCINTCSAPAVWELMYSEGGGVTSGRWGSNNSSGKGGGGERWREGEEMMKGGGQREGRGKGVGGGEESPWSGNQVRVEQIYIDVKLKNRGQQEQSLYFDKQEEGEDKFDPGALNLPSLKLANKLQLELSRLEFPIFDSTTTGNSQNGGYSLRDICLESRYQDHCIVYSPLEFWHNDVTTLPTYPSTTTSTLSSPFTQLSRTVSQWEVPGSFGLPVPAWTVFSGLRLAPQSDNLVGAEALLLTYFLKGGEVTTTSGSEGKEEGAAIRWERLWGEVVGKLPKYCEEIGGLMVDKVVRGEGEVKTNHFKFTSRRQRISTEFLVLSLGYLTVILYLFFFLGRFQLVKSKFWLGFAAVFLLNVSLLMSYGLCCFFGYELHFLPWEVVPILIIAVGAENMLRLTNSVVSTSLDLPVKERIGVGVRNCSVGVTAHLIGELSILGAATLSSNPALREFGWFGSIAIIIDYVLQLTFFIAVLSIDIRRLELSDLQDRNLWPLPDSDTTKPSSLTLDSDESLILATIWEAMVMRLERMKSYSIFKFGLLGLSLIGVGIVSEKLRTSSFFSQQEDLRLSESILRSRYQLDAKFWEVINPAQSDLYIEFRPPTKIHLTWSPSESELNDLTTISHSPTTTPSPPATHKPSLRFMMLLLTTGGLITMYLRFLARGRRQEKAQWESLNPRNTIRIFKGMWADVVLLASNGKELVAALSLSGELIVWSYFVDSLVFRSDTGLDPPITGLAISTTGWLAYGDTNGVITLLHLGTTSPDPQPITVAITYGHSDRTVIQLAFLPQNPDILVARTKGGHLITCHVPQSKILFRLDDYLRATHFRPTSSDIIVGLLRGDLILLSMVLEEENQNSQFQMKHLPSFGSSTIVQIASLELEGRVRAFLVGYSNFDAELFLVSDGTTLCQLAFPSCDNRHQDSLLDLSLAVAPDGIYVIRSHVGYTLVSHVAYRDPTLVAPPTSPTFHLNRTSSVSFTGVGCPYSIVLPHSLLVGLSRSAHDWELWGMDLSLSSLEASVQHEKLKYQLIADPLLHPTTSSPPLPPTSSTPPTPPSTVDNPSSPSLRSRDCPWVPFGSIVLPPCPINEHAGVVIAMSNYLVCCDPTTLFATTVNTDSPNPSPTP